MFIFYDHFLLEYVTGVTGEVPPGMRRCHTNCTKTVQHPLIGLIRKWPIPATENPGGLNGSVQHLLAVYLPESEIPKFFLDADLIAVPPRRAPLENTLTSLFF